MIDGSACPNQPASTWTGTPDRKSVVAVEHQGDKQPENGHARAPSPCPVRVDSPSPLFTPTSYADAAGSSLHQRGELRMPGDEQETIADKG